ncbi:hypothetical protein MAR_025814 [Mya arenaria]|uniref:Cupin-like domain-containing protein n=1 Tax=Mya arenaria TaxID=6604 RepID=A0ABY7ERS6_MYAAR|nr:hypothetical protein MAR_025814 [Mya arenaria]
MDQISGKSSELTSSPNKIKSDNIKTPCPNGEQESGKEEFNMEEEFLKLYQKAKRLRLTEKDFQKIDILQRISWEASYKKLFVTVLLYMLVLILILFVSVIFVCLFNFPVSRNTLLHGWFYLTGSVPEHEQCAVNMPEFVSNVFRPPMECSFCKDVKEIKTVYNISQEDFEELYAYSGVPVVIGDGSANWTATEFFSFDFFKDLYKPGSQALENQKRNCQFFPYKTDFVDLEEVLTMTANTLRKHYRRPYFLPRLSESSKTDWIFMGSPGYGAHMHIDNVQRPSWQAQITGTKRWTLEPPPECYYVCEDQLQVTVQPGQIIVLDTNIWFHSTLNVGSDISITIGSEYD